jgi:hypothetical protein
VLLGVVTMIQRLRASGGPTAATAEVASSESFG